MIYVSKIAAVLKKKNCRGKGMKTKTPVLRQEITITRTMEVVVIIKRSSCICSRIIRTFDRMDIDGG